MSEIRILDYRWAVIGAGRKAWREYGQGIERDEADQTAMLALADCPRTFKPELGSFGVYAKKAAYNAVKRASLKSRRHAACALDEQRESAAETGEDLRQIEAWAGHCSKRRELLAQLQRDETLLTAEQRRLLGELRAELSGIGNELEERRADERCVATAEAARQLKMAERRVRSLCAQGKLPAYRSEGGSWAVPVRDLRRFRHKKIVSALEAGQTYREARAAARCSLRTVHCAAKRAELSRSRGRPRKHDHEQIKAMLTDAAAFPEVWRDGLPMVRAIARAVGCGQQQVQRIARALA